MFYVPLTVGPITTHPQGDGAVFPQDSMPIYQSLHTDDPKLVS